MKKMMSKVAMKTHSEHTKPVHHGMWLWLFFTQSFILAWPDVQEMCNTLVYPPVIPAVFELEPISVILIR